MILSYVRLQKCMHWGPCGWTRARRQPWLPHRRSAESERKSTNVRSHLSHLSHLCLFHTLRSISREVTLEKMGIRVGQRDALLGVFNAMAVARSEQAFDDQCTALEGMNIPAALTQLAAHPAGVGPVFQVEVFHPWRDHQQQVGKPQREDQECLLPLLWMHSLSTSSRCCVCCAVRRNTRPSSIASAQHRGRLHIWRMTIVSTVPCWRRVHITTFWRRFPCGTRQTYLWMAPLCCRLRVHCLWRSHRASVHSGPHTVCHVATPLPVAKWMGRLHMPRASLTAGGLPDIHVMRCQQPQCESVKSPILLPRVPYSLATRSTSKLWKSLFSWRVSLPRSAWGNSGSAWPHWKLYNRLGRHLLGPQQHSRSSPPSCKKG